MVFLGADDVGRLESDLHPGLELALLYQFCTCPGLHFNFCFGACDHCSRFLLLFGLSWKKPTKRTQLRSSGWEWRELRRNAQWYHGSTTTQEVRHERIRRSEGMRNLSDWVRLRRRGDSFALQQNALLPHRVHWDVDQIQSPVPTVQAPSHALGTPKVCRRTRC